MIMSASIFRFPNAKSGSRPKPPEPFKSTSYYIDFTFGGKEYWATFSDQDLVRVSLVYYRLQLGKRVRAVRHLDDPEQALVDAACSHSEGKRVPGSERLHNVVQSAKADAQTVDLIEQVDRFKKSVGQISQQLKAGKLPHSSADQLRSAIAAFEAIMPSHEEMTL